MKTTKYDWVEFRKGKGFRHVSQTVNPKTGKLNAEKKSTYYDVMLLGRDENDHVKSAVCSFYGNEGINKDCMFLSDNFGLFTPQQIKDIVSVLLGKLIVSIKAQVIYCNSNSDALEYYTADPYKRCVNNTSCSYSPKRASKEGISEGCLIGRHLDSETQEKADDVKYDSDIRSILEYNPDFIPLWMQDLGKIFLCDCQTFHDADKNWHPFGLSNTGKEALKRIIEYHSLDKSQFEKYL